MYTHNDNFTGINLNTITTQQAQFAVVQKNVRCLLLGYLLLQEPLDTFSQSATLAKVSTFHVQQGPVFIPLTEDILHNI